MRNLSDNIMNVLMNIVRWLEEQKVAQPQNSGIRIYKKNAPQWSGMATIANQTAYSRSAFFTVTATAKNQPYVYGKMIPTLRLTPTGPRYTRKDLMQQTTTYDNMFDYFYDYGIIRTDDPKTLQWSFLVTAPPNKTFYMDIQVVSTDDVDIIVSKQ